MLKVDLPNDGWRKRLYHVSLAEDCPSANYFPAWRFKEAVEGTLKASSGDGEAS